VTAASETVEHFEALTGWRMEIKSRYDVVIIGSGAGGSTLAFPLSLHGRKVLVVEQGSQLRPLKQWSTGPAGIHLKQAMAGRDSRRWPVGGQTKFFGAALYRMRESDFRQVEHEAGISPAWPLSYWDLEPYYQQAEELYRVHGSPDGDPSEPPRLRPYPYPPIPHCPVVSEVVSRLNSSGASVSAIPKGIDYSDTGKCILCATCDAYYCRLDAKMDAEIAALRPALRTGSTDLETDTECTKVITDTSGRRAIGVVLRHDGTDRVVHADTVVVSAGTQQSVALLRRSRTDKHPEGLGNNGGALGRNLAGHSVGMVFPLVSWRPIEPIHSKTFAMNAFHDGAADFPYPIGVIQAAGQMPFWEEASPVIRPAARLIGKHSLMCFYMSEALPTRESRLLLDGDWPRGRVEPLHKMGTFDKLRRIARDAFRCAGYVVVARKQPPVLWHQVGTARMGTDPTDSVVDAHCRVHGIEGLFVVDASVLPSAGAVNTGLTIVALALRTADLIAGKPLRVGEATSAPLRELLHVDRDG
jgi:choline dehydrogenase-like flavoprotein